MLILHNSIKKRRPRGSSGPLALHRRVALEPTILATGNAMTAMTTNSADQSRPQPRVVALRAGKAVFL